MSTPFQRNNVLDMARAFESGSGNEEMTRGRVRTVEPIRLETTVAQRVRDLQGRGLEEEKDEVGESSAPPDENAQLPTEDRQGLGNTPDATSSEFVTIAGEIWPVQEIFGDEWPDLEDESPEANQGGEGEKQEKKQAGNKPDTLSDMIRIAGQSKMLLLALGEALPVSLKASGAKVEKDFLASNKDRENPIVLLSRLANALLPAHDELFKNLHSAEDTRNIADIVLEFLSSVECFESLLGIKNECIPEIQKMRSADGQLDRAFGEFEATVGVRKGKSKVVNLKKADKLPLEEMITKLLKLPNAYSIAMEFCSRLSYDEIEKSKLRDAVVQLKEVIKIMEDKDLELPSQTAMFSLNERSDGLFDALRYGRMLIYNGKVKEMLNGTAKKRHLVIFTDGLWLCKPKLLGDGFNMSRSQHLRFDSILVESFRSEEGVQKWRVNCTESLNQFVLVFKSVEERIYMDSLIHLIKEKFRSIQEHQIKTNANREETFNQEN